MSYKNILNLISPNKTIFDIEFGVLSAPVRHCFMMGTVWYLKKQNPKLKNLNILEIGSWLGASALSFAQGLIEYNNEKGKITCVDAWQPFFDNAKNNLDVHKNMEALLSSDAAYNIFLHNINTLPKTITHQHLKGTSDNILPM